MGSISRSNVLRAQIPKAQKDTDGALSMDDVIAFLGSARVTPDHN